MLSFFIGTNVIQAQSDVDFGLKGGLNLTFFKVPQDAFGNSPVISTSFYGGGFVDFYVEDHFSIQPEFLYIVLNDFNFINASIACVTTSSSYVNLSNSFCACFVFSRFDTVKSLVLF